MADAPAVSSGTSAAPAPSPIKSIPASIWGAIVSKIKGVSHEIADFVESDQAGADIKALFSKLESPAGLALLEELSTAVAMASQPLSLQTFAGMAAVGQKVAALLDEVAATAPAVSPTVAAVVAPK